MAQPSRVGPSTRLLTWLIAAMAPAALATASGMPWQWGFAASYTGAAFLLQALVRLKHLEVERFVHILVLSGGAPFAVRVWYGMDLSPVAVVHVAALSLTSIAVGYMAADRVRHLRPAPSAQRRSHARRAGGL